LYLGDIKTRQNGKVESKMITATLIGVGLTLITIGLLPF